MTDALIITHSGDHLIARDATQEQINGLTDYHPERQFIQIGDVVVAIGSIQSACLCDEAKRPGEVGHNYTEADLQPEG